MLVQEGEGWRWLEDSARHPFSVVIGGQGWASELTAEEAQGLGHALVQLVQEHHALASQLMPEESISLELERGPFWIALEGDRNSWSLRFVLTPGADCRAVEGSWLPGASAALVAALAQGASQHGCS